MNAEYLFRRLPSKYRGLSGLYTYVEIVASLIMEKFSPNPNYFAYRFDTREQIRGFATWLARHDIDYKGSIDIGTWKPQGSRDERTPLTAKVVESHVAGDRTLGGYPLRVGGFTDTGSIDFDAHLGASTVAADPRADFEATARVLMGLDVPFLGVHSRGGRGYWTHVLLPFGTPAREARRLLRWVLRTAGVRHITDGGTFDSIFPKQDDLSADGGPGNLYCFPLSLKWMLLRKVPGTHFVGVDPRDLDGQLAHLEAAQRIGSEQWAKLMELVPDSQEAAVSAPAHSQPTIVEAGGAAGGRGSARLSAWAFALLRAGRLGRPLGDGKYAVLCINDHEHTHPDRTAKSAGGSCVLMPPKDERNIGFPYCAHAHCAHMTHADWIAAVGADSWNAALRLASGGSGHG